MAGCLLKHSVPGDVPKPRLNLITTLTISAPIVCHHCADAPCVASLPEGALYSMRPRGRQAGALHRLPQLRARLSLWSRGGRLPGGRGQVGGLTVESAPKASLVKCDLCYDREGGPACVEACPTGGLMVVDEEELADRQRQRRMRAAVASGAFSSVPLNTDLN